MPADTDQPTLAVTQADRKTYQELRGLWGPRFQERLDGGEFDKAWDMQLLARHRTNSEPRPAGDLREVPAAAFVGAADYVVRFEAALAQQKDDPSASLTYLASQAEVAVRYIKRLIATHSPAPMAGEGKYLVWSNEHKAWWGVDHRGYTRFIERAGRYDRAEALKIAGTRDGGWRLNKGNPDEIAIPEQDAIDQYADITAAQAAAHPSTQEGGDRG